MEPARQATIEFLGKHLALVHLISHYSKERAGEKPYAWRLKNGDRFEPEALRGLGALPSQEFDGGRNYYPASPAYPEFGIEAYESDSNVDWFIMVRALSSKERGDLIHKLAFMGFGPYDVLPLAEPDIPAERISDVMLHAFLYCVQTRPALVEQGLELDDELREVVISSLVPFRDPVGTLETFLAEERLDRYLLAVAHNAEAVFVKHDVLRFAPVVLGRFEDELRTALARPGIPKTRQCGLPVPKGTCCVVLLGNDAECPRDHSK